MSVAVELGGETHHVDVPAHATAADVVDPLPVSIHEVSVVVDGNTLAGDASLPPDAESVRVVRLIKGG